ncbi:hypothetical protein AAC387_Pa08g1848 [Persea americana]
MRATKHLHTSFRSFVVAAMLFRLYIALQQGDPSIGSGAPKLRKPEQTAMSDPTGLHSMEPLTTVEHPINSNIPIANPLQPISCNSLNKVTSSLGRGPVVF